MNYKLQKHHIKTIVHYIPPFLNTNILLKRLLFIFILLVIHQNGIAQNKIKDSLWRISQTNSLPDTTRLQAINVLIKKDYYLQQIDSLLPLANLQQQLAVNSGLHDHIANALNTKAYYFECTNKPELALSYYLKSVTSSESIQDTLAIINTYEIIANIYNNIGKLNEALTYLYKKQKLEKQIGAQISRINTNLMLTLIYGNKGDYKKALVIYEKHIAVSDSLINLDNQRALAEQEIQYKYDKKRIQDSITNSQQQQIHLLKLDAAKTKEERNRYLLYTVSLLSMVLAFIGCKAYCRKQSVNKKLRWQNDNKNAIIKEIHHRVKNNLQVINSLLFLQSREIEDEKVIESFKEAQNRVLSMALLHEKMYLTDDFENIDIKEHITFLVNDLVKNNVIDKDITTNLKIENINIGIKTLVPLGLIINEVITNAVKYAFTNQDKGIIMVHLEQVNDKTYKMLIGDNGNGTNTLKNSTGMGTLLIENFTKQLGGTLSILNQPGTVYEIFFKSVDHY